MRRFLLFLVACFLLSLLLPGTHAADQEADTCSNTDIQTAIDAAGDGDTVTVPSGDCTWTGGVTIPDTKGIVLQGAGVDVTTVGGDLLRINLGTTTQVTRVTGFTFTSSIPIRIFSFTSAETQEFRIDNNKFSGGVWVTCRCYGVIDHNQFVATNVFTMVRVFEAAYDLGGGGVFADGGGASWARAESLGTRDAVYFEDNTITITNPATGNSCLDGRSGGRAVVRNNTIKNVTCGTHDAEIENERGMRQYEVYDNTFIYDDNINTAFMNERGGTGVIADNCFKKTNGMSFTQTGRPYIIRISRGNVTGSTDPWASACDATDATDKICLGAVPKVCTSDGDCTGDFAGTCLRIDGTGSEGNLCRDQLGAGKDNASTGVQDAAPMYFWDNESCSTAGADCACSTLENTVSVATSRNSATQLQDGRDFFATDNDPMPGYTKFTYPHPLVSGDGSGATVSGSVKLSGTVKIQ